MTLDGFCERLRAHYGVAGADVQAWVRALDIEADGNVHALALEAALS